MTSEFELIDRIRQRVSGKDGVRVGIGDDACVLEPSPNKQLVCTTDSIVLDRHFTDAWAASEIGHLAMAVNLSDLAAMGAKPRWALLSLTLPNHAPWTDTAWLDEFLDGFLAVDPNVVLAGGNMASGPLNIGACLFGEVDSGQAIGRSGAEAGDALVVTGHLGDVAGAMALPNNRQARNTPLCTRMKHPTPRLEVGQQAWGFVHAMIDISDGLLADLGHLLAASSKATTESVGAIVWLDKLPASQALTEAFDDNECRWSLQLSGGSDYELLMSVPQNKLDAWLHRVDQAGVPACVIGEVTASAGIAVLKPNGQPFASPGRGWDHFQSP